MTAQCHNQCYWQDLLLAAISAIGKTYCLLLACAASTAGMLLVPSKAKWAAAVWCR
jgi:hypothetical protein